MLDDEYNDFEEMNDSKDITIPPLKKINHEKKEKKNKNKKISIEDIDGKKIKNVKITSPRTKAAMIKLGYVDEDLNFLTFKEFIQKNPNLTGAENKIKKNRYEYIINLREKRINEIIELREKINPDELSTQYFLIKKSNNNSSKMNFDNSKYKSTMIENQKKEFQRLKNKNEKELLGMIQYELKRELMKKEAEDKIENDRIKKEKYEKEIIKKRKKEEKLRREKEKEEEKKQKELENYQKKLERERYEEEIRKAKEEEKQEKKRLKEEKKKI